MLLNKLFSCFQSKWIQEPNLFLPDKDEGEILGGRMPWCWLGDIKWWLAIGGDNILQDSLLNGGGLVDIRVWQLAPRLDINACLRRLVELSRARFSSFTISIDMCCGGRLAREGRRCVSDGLTALLAGLEVTLLNQPISPSISFRMLLTNLSST